MPWVDIENPDAGVQDQAPAPDPDAAWAQEQGSVSDGSQEQGPPEGLGGLGQPDNQGPATNSLEQEQGPDTYTGDQVEPINQDPAPKTLEQEQEPRFGGEEQW